MIKTMARKHRGVSMPVLLIGTSILLIVFSSIYATWRLARLAERGKTLSTAVLPFHNALIMYGLAHRTQLITVPTGAVAGAVSPLEPTCAELKALMPSLLDYSCSLPEGGGAPLFSIKTIPAGCAGVGCDLAFAVTTANPLGSDADASEVVQQAVNHFGAEAGQSLVGFGATIRGTGWQRPNPVANQPRVFGTYATYGASTLSKFLTLYDTRDPNFMGNVTVAGSVTSGSGISVGDGSCKFTELTLDGRVIARSPSCVERVVANGASGLLETKSATGATTVQLSERVAMFNASGMDKAGFRYTASASEIYADRFRNNAGSAGINADGSVFAGDTTVAALMLSAAQTVNTACTANSFARSADGRWMECFAGMWRFTGVHQANVGDTCVGGFAQDIVNATVPLICRNNQYVNLNQATGLVSIIDSLVVADGSVVPPASCATGAVPLLMTDLTRFQTPTAGGSLRLTYTGSGPWTISMTGAGGGEAIVWRGCRYPNF